jgi:DNA-directed RNA polymerase specialized sigma24 family protein
MAAIPLFGNRPLARAHRPMSSAGTLIDEPRDWAAEMAAVAAHADRESFLRIYDHFMPRVCLYIRGLGATEAVAEDVAQEAMLRLWQHARGYDPQRSAVSTGPDPGDALEDPGPPTTVEDQAECAQLRRRIDDLSPVQARLIRMSYYEAKSHQDIADELGMPLGTVKSHLRRAVLRLQGEMGESE